MKIRTHRVIAKVETQRVCFIFLVDELCFATVKRLQQRKVSESSAKTFTNPTVFFVQGMCSNVSSSSKQEIRSRSRSRDPLSVHPAFSRSNNRRFLSMICPARNNGGVGASFSSLPAVSASDSSSNTVVSTSRRHRWSCGRYLSRLTTRPTCTHNNLQRE